MSDHWVEGLVEFGETKPSGRSGIVWVDDPGKKFRECAQVGSVPNPELPVFDAMFPPNILPLNSLDEPNEAVEAVSRWSMNLHVIGRDLPMLVRIGTSGEFSDSEPEPIRSFWNDAPANHVDAVVRFLG